MVPDQLQHAPDCLKSRTGHITAPVYPLPITRNILKSPYLCVQGRPETAKIRGANLLVLVVLQNHYGQTKKERR